jgi:WD40 repeat protein
LTTFGPADADRFFGREHLVEELASRVAEASFLAVFGASGAGKSSVLRAGLIPAVLAGAVPGGRNWRTVVLTPGERSTEELTIHLANLLGVAASGIRESLLADPSAIALIIRQAMSDRPPAARLLIVVDQFEEVFSLCQDEPGRRRFVGLLLTAATEPRARVVLGVRADFYARCAEHPDLVAALRDRQLLVGPLDGDGLRKAITEPARQAGLMVDPALVEVVVAEAVGQPGALPLVSHALLETWRRRRGGRLTLAGYRETGGVSGAVAQTAERVYGELCPAEQRVAREVFLRLSALGESTDDTRRRAARAELLGGPDPQAATAVLSRLTAARLVTCDRDSVSVAHEALIRGWPRLRGWLAEDRDLIRAQRRLTEAAADWRRSGRDTSLLYRGALLAAWENRSPDRLTGLEREFLLASRRHADGERAAGRRRVRLALTGAAAAVTVVAVLAQAALLQAGRANAERDRAVSRQLAAEARSRLQLDPDGALDLARRAFDAGPTAEAESVLRQAVADSRARGVVRVSGSWALGVAFGPDGRRLASSSEDGTVQVWAWSGDGVAPARPLVLTGPRGQVWNPVFSPDGRRVAAGGLDGAIRVWELTAPDRPRLLRGHRGLILNVAFTPDGTRLTSSGHDGTVRLWPVTGRGAPAVLGRHDGSAVGVAVSPDGRRVASSGHDRTIRLWDLAGRDAPRVLRGHEDDVKMLRFSPDGTRLASASIDGTARVWSLAGREPPAVLRGHEGTVEGVAFSPDGRLLATGSDDSTVRVWNHSGGGRDPLVLRGHRATVWSAVFSPDGRRLVSAAHDGTLRVWDPRGVGDPVWLRGHIGAAWTVAPVPDGTRVVSGGADGTVRVWSVTGGGRVLGRHDGEVLGVAVDPGGRRVASAGRDGTVRIWNLAGGAPVVLRGHRGPVWVAAFSPDGRRLASAGRDGTLRIWDTAGRRPPAVRRADADQIRYVAFDPDGRQVATAGADGTVRVWAVAGGAPRILRGHGGLVWAVAYSPDGTRLATSGDDGTVRVWDLTGTRGPLVLRGHQGFVWHAAFGPDGRWVASAGADGTARVWNVTGGGHEPITFRGFGTSVESVGFLRDGRRLVAAHGDGIVRVWRCDACAPLNHVLNLAGQRRPGA